MLSCFIIVLSSIASLCFFGNRVTARFEEINDAIYDFHWENLPLEFKKLLPTMMIISQKNVYIQGHMKLRCTHAFFGSVHSNTQKNNTNLLYFIYYLYALAFNCSSRFFNYRWLMAHIRSSCCYENLIINLENYLKTTFFKCLLLSNLLDAKSNYNSININFINLLFSLKKT